MDWVLKIFEFQDHHKLTDRQMAFHMRLSIRKFCILKTKPKRLGVELLRLKKAYAFFEQRTQTDPAKNALKERLTELNQTIPFHLYEEMMKHIEVIQRMIEGLKQKR